MIIARTASELNDARGRFRTAGRALALVPTMGALHEGHLALVRAARSSGNAVAVSIFVNPRQFNEPADLARYPVDHHRDLAMLAAEHVDLVWLPSAQDIYASGFATTISVGGPALGFEGEMRPGHFDGVATVVAVLFGVVRPEAAWFGEKDWQQLQMVRRLVEDLRLDVAVRGLPTVREPDGLPLSSRNRFLREHERARAAQLYPILRQAASDLLHDEAASVLARGRNALSLAGLQPDYLEMVAGTSLAPIEVTERDARLLCAVHVGDVRLLDNLPVTFVARAAEG